MIVPPARARGSAGVARILVRTPSHDLVAGSSRVCRSYRPEAWAPGAAAGHTNFRRPATRMSPAIVQTDQARAMLKPCAPTVSGEKPLIKMAADQKTAACHLRGRSGPVSTGYKATR